jgi:hypothetical protein
MARTNVSGPDAPRSIFNCTELRSGVPVAVEEGGDTLTARVRDSTSSSFSAAGW